jgi:hypothetical protein
MDRFNLSDAVEPSESSSSSSSKPPKASGNRPCTMPEGQVQSANVLILKKEADGQAYVLIGENAKSSQQYELPGGHCEYKDPSAHHTAARESHEETGGFLNLTPEQVSKMPYIVANPSEGNRVIFIHRDDNLDLKAMNRTIKAALKDEKLTRYFKEISSYQKIKLEKFLDALRRTSSDKKITFKMYKNQLNYFYRFP